MLPPKRHYLEIENDTNPAHYREHIQLGILVDVVLKKDQRTGRRTRGRVKWILTSKPYHSRGIKVILDSRKIGRVQEIIPEPSVEM